MALAAITALAARTILATERSAGIWAMALMMFGFAKSLHRKSAATRTEGLISP